MFLLQLFCSDKSGASLWANWKLNRYAHDLWPLALALCLFTCRSWPQIQRVHDIRNSNRWWYCMKNVFWHRNNPAIIYCSHAVHSSIQIWSKFQSTVYGLYCPLLSSCFPWAHMWLCPLHMLLLIKIVKTEKVVTQLIPLSVVWSHKWAGWCSQCCCNNQLSFCKELFKA